MKFIDLAPQYELIRSDLDARLKAIFAHQQFVHGPEEQALEVALAARVGVKHCIAVASGTTALQVALMALDIGPGDEVIVPAFSFFATAEVVMLLGAKPVLVDVDEATFNIDPHLIEAAITPNTRAIMPVGLFGQCPEMNAINEIAKHHNLPVVEDAAQSFGATHYGRLSCGFSTIACTSFFPSKPLGCYGDGGACFTDDDALASKVHLLIHHGEETRYNHTMLGLNGRLDTMQAAVLLAKLAVFDEEIRLRQQVADWYTSELKDFCIVPNIASYNTSVFAQYTLRVKNRDALRDRLNKKGIPTAVHYPKPMHKQPIFASQGWVAHCPVAEKAAAEVVSLPFYPYLDQTAVRTIASELLAVCSAQAA